MTVTVGLERLVAGEFTALRNKRIGLIANPTSVLRDLRFGLDALLETGYQVKALFGPEHGLRGDVQYMESVDEAKDGKTGLPVHSLYGSSSASLSPKAEWFQGLDALVFDIQDVGARYYTYVWTMVLAMREASKYHLEFVVLDRPNPINGIAVEGGAITSGFESFVGLKSIPNRHGLTAGEIATWAHRQEGLADSLTVIKMKDWQRAMWFEQTGQPWVLPSPNMPTVDTALVYPGMCLLEGTWLSEGRGTTKPFEMFGAPFIDGEKLAAVLREEKLPGVAFRACTFTPTWNKHEKKQCGGVALHVTHRDTFLPYLTAVTILYWVHELWPEQFRFWDKAYEFVENIPAIDLLAGSSQLREGLLKGLKPAEIAQSWQVEQNQLADQLRAFHLYD